MSEHVREDDRDELPPDEEDRLLELYNRDSFDDADDLAAYNANEADDYRHEGEE